MASTSIERPNVIALKKLIANRDAIKLTLTAEQLKPIKGPGGKTYDIFDQVEKYLKSMKKDGTVKVTYNYSKNHLPTFPGRQFAKGGVSMQSMKRWMRHLLANKTYHDLDMKNCHPTLLSQLCKKKGWVTPVLDNYLVNREDLLKEMVGLSRDVAKEVVLSIMNYSESSAYKKLDYRPLWLIDFKKEIENIQINLFQDTEYSDLFENLTKHDKKFNKIGSLMNHILCNIENKCLMKGIQYQESKNPVLAFDGFQHLKNQPLKDFTLMSEYISRETTFDTEWVIKPMDEGIDLSMYPDPPEETEPDEMSDLQMFNFVFENNKDFIKRFENKTWIFDETIGMWESENARGKYITMCEKLGLGNSIKSIRDSFAYCEKLPDSSTFFQNATENRLGKLLYSNKIRDLEKHECIDFSFEYFFTKRIDRPFNEDRNEENIKKVKKQLYEDPHESEAVRNELWKTLSMGMTGRNIQRGYTSCIGRTRCGKSTLMNANINAFQPFVQSMSALTFVSSKFSKANDHNGKLLLLKDTRLVFVSEKPGSGQTDGELWKGVTGGDPIEARQCGQKAEKASIPESYMIALGNSPLQFDNKDLALQERNKSFKWTKQFPADIKVVDFFKTIETKEAMDHLVDDGIKLFQKEGFLQVQELIDFTNEINEEDDHFLNKMEETFDLSVDTDNQNTWISSTTVYKVFKGILKSEYEIKERFKDQGIVSGRFRKTEVKEVKDAKGTITTYFKAGDINQKMYFKGLVFKQRENLTCTTADY